MGGCLGREWTKEEHETLRSWQRSEKKARFLRARIVVPAEKTANAAVIARAIGAHVQTVRDLARVFRGEGLAGPEPKFRPGCPRRFSQKKVEPLTELGYSEMWARML